MARAAPRAVRSLGILVLIGCHGAAGTPPATTDASPAGDATPLADAAPGAIAPALLLDGTGLYPRAVQLADGTIRVSLVTPLPSGRMGGTILRSADDGVTFDVLGHIDDPITASGLCCASLLELSGGRLLWAASVGGDTPAAPMTIVAWRSDDGGATWTRHATIATGAVPRGSGGLWEPELELAADGTLVCHYSDETDPAHSQKLVERRSSDGGVTWSAAADTVALAASAARPGMASVRRLADGSYRMSYEVCGVDGCAAHLRASADGWSWGAATDIGPRPATVDGVHFRHAPTLAWSPAPGNGRLYLVGQMAYDAGGAVAAENGRVMFANTEAGGASWFALAAPAPVAMPYDNFCPNYSSSVVPLDGGVFALEVATQWDGNTCRAYAARGRLDGDGAAMPAGAHALVNVESALCLDVSGGSTAAGTTIQQWTCNGMPPQAWTAEPAAGGTIALTAANSGMCLAVRGASAKGAAIEQQPCDGSPQQAWTARAVGVGAFTLVHEGLCLDDAGGSAMAGNPMQLWSCNDLAPQIWQLR